MLLFISQPEHEKVASVRLGSLTCTHLHNTNSLTLQLKLALFYFQAWAAINRVIIDIWNVTGCMLKQKIILSQNILHVF